MAQLRRYAPLLTTSPGFTGPQAPEPAGFVILTRRCLARRADYSYSLASNFSRVGCRGVRQAALVGRLVVGGVEAGRWPPWRPWH